MKTSRQLFAKMLLLFVTIVWGSGYIVNEYIIREGMDPRFTLTIRFIAGATLICILFKKRIISRTPFQTVFHGIIAGIILFLALYTETIGQSKTTVSNAALITSMNVIIVPYLVWIITHKRPSKHTFMYSFIAMVGVVFLSESENNIRNLSLNSGDIIVLFGAFLFALQIIWIGYFCRKDNPEKIAFIQLLIAGLCSSVFLILSGNPILATNIRESIIPILYLGLFPTGICYYLQSYAERFVEATDAAIIFSAEGVFGSLFSLLVGFEKFHWRLLIGSSLILLSIFKICKHSEIA
ncbi:MAG: EamA family transporter [Methanobrevibacter sp.]|nr:EamA family transporter [Methanobrevibacter sp.]